MRQAERRNDRLDTDVSFIRGTDDEGRGVVVEDFGELAGQAVDIVRSNRCACRWACQPPMTGGWWSSTARV